MKKILSIILVLTVVSMITVSLFGCAGTKTTTSSSTTTALTEATITIGTDSPLTGPAATWGLGVMHGVTLACEDMNAAGGLTIGNTHYTFKAESLDDKYDTATGTDNIRQFIYTDGIKFMFTFETGSTLAMAPIITQQKVLTFTIVGDNNCIKQPTAAYIFRTYTPTEMQVTPILQWIKQQHPDIKTLVSVATDTANGQVVVNWIKTAAPQNGLTDIDQIMYDPATTDFTPFATKIMSENPDLLETTNMPGGTAALLYKSLHDMGYKGVIWGPTVSATDMVPIAGADALEGIIDTSLAMSAPTVGDAVLGLPAREVAKWGSSYGVTWDFYTQATLMFEAMKAANSVDPTAVKDILQAGNHQWPYVCFNGGFATFNSAAAQKIYGADATNQINDPFALSIVHNGADTIAVVIPPQ